MARSTDQAVQYNIPGKYERLFHHCRMAKIVSECHFMQERVSLVADSLTPLTTTNKYMTKHMSKLFTLMMLIVWTHNALFLQYNISYHHLLILNIK